MIGRRVLLAVGISAVALLYTARVTVGLPWYGSVLTGAILPIGAFVWLLARRPRRYGPRQRYG